VTQGEDEEMESESFMVENALLKLNQCGIIEYQVHLESDIMFLRGNGRQYCNQVVVGSRKYDDIRMHSTGDRVEIRSNVSTMDVGKH
jgi:hypothetical protein